MVNYNRINNVTYMAFTGRIFFAVAIIGLGITHFIFNDFMTGRAPAWPDSVPGGLFWAYSTGLLFIGSGVAFLIPKKARGAVIFAGLLIFIWALARHIPVIAADSFLSPSWTAAGKAPYIYWGDACDCCFTAKSGAWR